MNRTNNTLTRPRLDRAARADWRQPIVDLEGCDICGHTGGGDSPLALVHDSGSVALLCRECRTSHCPTPASGGVGAHNASTGTPPPKVCSIARRDPPLVGKATSQVSDSILGSRFDLVSPSGRA